MGNQIARPVQWEKNKLEKPAYKLVDATEAVEGKE